MKEDQEEIFNEIKRHVSEKLDVPEELITPETSFVNDLGADSLDLIELIIELEIKFNAHVANSELSKFSLVKDVINYIVKIQNPKGKNRSEET